MRRILTWTAFTILCTTAAFADTFRGKLIDASCATQSKPAMASCEPTSSTTAFALTDDTGKTYLLDDQGNSKAADALKSRADRSADPGSSSKNEVVMVTISGTLDGNKLKVDTIEVR